MEVAATVVGGGVAVGALPPLEAAVGLLCPLDPLPPPKPPLLIVLPPEDAVGCVAPKPPLVLLNVPLELLDPVDPLLELIGVLPELPELKLDWLVGAGVAANPDEDEKLLLDAVPDGEFDENELEGADVGSEKLLDPLLLPLALVELFDPPALPTLLFVPPMLSVGATKPPEPDGDEMGAAVAAADAADVESDELDSALELVGVAAA